MIVCDWLRLITMGGDGSQLVEIDRNGLWVVVISCDWLGQGIIGHNGL